MAVNRTRQMTAPWRLVSKIADIGGIYQSVFLAMPALGVAIGIFRTQAIWIWYVVSPMALIVGVISGALLLHPYLSSRAMRQQTELEFISTHISAKFGTCRVPYEWIHKRTVRALVDGISTFDVVLNYGAATNRITIAPKSGIREVGNLERTSFGFHKCTLKFDKTLGKRESHEFSFEIIVPRDADQCQPMMTISPAHPCGDTRISVMFDAKDMPQTIRKAYWITPIAQTEYLQNVLRPDSVGCVNVRYRRLKPGHKYGFVWEWD